jgi:DNA mismatch endonuclease Vsr
MRPTHIPSYRGLEPASEAASIRARASSKKVGTRCEVLLNTSLAALNCDYECNSTALPGKPDFAFSSRRLAVFCDGDFWHGHFLKTCLNKLRRGHNHKYWVAKISANVVRDQRVRKQLRRLGWSTMRLWESTILRDPDAAARKIVRRLIKLSTKRAR